MVGLTYVYALFIINDNVLDHDISIFSALVPCRSTQKWPQASAAVRLW